MPCEGRLGSNENKEHHVAAYPVSEMYVLLLFYFGQNETSTGKQNHSGLSSYLSKQALPLFSKKPTAFLQFFFSTNDFSHATPDIFLLIISVGAEDRLSNNNFYKILFSMIIIVMSN